MLPTPLLHFISPLDRPEKQLIISVNYFIRAQFMSFIRKPFLSRCGLFYKGYFIISSQGASPSAHK